MSAGVRIRVVAGPWPERIGSEGRIVRGPLIYPWAGLLHRQVVVRLDDDPLSATRDSGPNTPDWTCVLLRCDIQVLPGGEP